MGRIGKNRNVKTVWHVLRIIDEDNRGFEKDGTLSVVGLYMMNEKIG